MSSKRKPKSQQRKARRNKLHQPQQTARLLSGKEVSIRREVDYIVRRAAERDGRVVSLGPVVLFSTQTGDAWLLDPEDRLALCLARDGEPQPVNIMDTEGTFAIEWDRTYSMVGDRFTTVEKQTGRVSTVLGYPTQAILAHIEQVGG